MWTMEENEAARERERAITSKTVDVGCVARMPRRCSRICGHNVEEL